MLLDRSHGALTLVRIKGPRRDVTENLRRSWYEIHGNRRATTAASSRFASRSRTWVRSRAILAAVAPHNSGFQTVVSPLFPRVCSLSNRTNGNWEPDCGVSLPRDWGFSLFRTRFLATCCQSDVFAPARAQERPPPAAAARSVRGPRATVAPGAGARERGSRTSRGDTTHRSRG